jgi:hypothetical protein
MRKLFRNALIVATQSAGLLLAASSLAYAADCASLQKGNEVFADTFTDNTGGWPADPDANIDKSGLTLHLYAPNSSWVYLNNTFNASDGDYCLEGILPKAPAANNAAYLGLVFLAKDASTFDVLQVDSSGGIALWRKVSGTWTQVANLSRPTLVPTPGSTVVLRAVVKGTLISVSVNGTDLQKVRIQVPTGPLDFGIYAQTESNVAKPGVGIQITKYRVTAGQ